MDSDISTIITAPTTSEASDPLTELGCDEFIINTEAGSGEATSRAPLHAGPSCANLVT